MKLLLIEPDRVLATTYGRALQQAGHTVQVAATAQTAIHAADQRRPDAVIMELQLVGHSGIEFLYEFRSYEDWSAIPALVLTGVPAGEFADSWELLRDHLGVRAYHYKPITSLRTLLTAVAGLYSAPNIV